MYYQKKEKMTVLRAEAERKECGKKLQIGGCGVGTTLVKLSVLEKGIYDAESVATVHQS